MVFLNQWHCFFRSLRHQPNRGLRDIFVSHLNGRALKWKWKGFYNPNGPHLLQLVFIKCGCFFKITGKLRSGRKFRVNPWSTEVNRIRTEALKWHNRDGYSLWKEEKKMLIIKVNILIKGKLRGRLHSVSCSHFYVWK